MAWYYNGCWNLHFDLFIFDTPLPSKWEVPISKQERIWKSQPMSHRPQHFKEIGVWLGTHIHNHMDKDARP